ncbi:hypothetical protein BT69DRAFT_1333789 [Atractiella rhizophila]|nr:hypothetical protein BT69DRAFT_1333789 [Atractiella rhizophila]
MIPIRSPTLNAPRGYKIYVGKTHVNTTQETVRGIFSSFGSLIEVFRMDPMEGSDECYFFVTFREQHTAEAAIDYFHSLGGLHIDGKAVSVGWAKATVVPKPSERGGRPGSRYDPFYLRHKGTLEPVNNMANRIVSNRRRAASLLSTTSTSSSNPPLPSSVRSATTPQPVSTSNPTTTSLSLLSLIDSSSLITSILRNPVFEDPTLPNLTLVNRLVNDVLQLLVRDQELAQAVLQARPQIERLLMMHLPSTASPLSSTLEVNATDFAATARFTLSPDVLPLHQA